ncbi:MAG: DUF4249 domain-containing protein [Bacteroidota bacterium]
MKQIQRNRFSYMAVIILSVLLMVSCESVLFIELEESDKLIVVNGAFGHDSIVAVQVSRTRHILDNAPLVPLENATVMFYRDGSLLEQLEYMGNGRFQSDAFISMAGEQYSLEVENQGYPSVSATCEIPEAVEIASVDTSTVTEDLGNMYYSHMQELFHIDVSLEDPAGEENYYMITSRADRSATEYRDTTVLVLDSLFQNGKWYPYVKDSTYTISEIFRFTDDVHIGSEDLIVEAITQDGILFSDQLIDGKEYSVRVTTWTDNMMSADSAIVEVRLHSISESYYKYLKSRQNHYESVDDYLSVPVIVYTNVEGGTGFLGGYSTDVYSFTTFIPEYYEEYWYYEYDGPFP